MWACYLGTISDSYRENWSPHPVSCDHPDVFDVLDTAGRSCTGWTGRPQGGISRI